METQSMKWTVRIALCLPLLAGLAALAPLGKAPAGELGLPGCDGLEPCKAQKGPPMLLVKDRRIKLNYNITDVGPSGIACVELWATRDGKHWQRYSNEPPPSGPLCVHVAEEGKYGFSLVVKNGLGIASPAPKAGEAPQLWVEVDETPPSVQLTECAVGYGDSLVIGWTANDVHLADNPISVSTAVSKDGPWTVVASGLSNTGRFVWKMPKDLPYEFFVKVDAADQAGNVGGDQTARPVKVDLCKPRGTITGIDSEKKIEVKAEPAPVPLQVTGFQPDLAR
jgi:hypothetical protein